MQDNKILQKFFQDDQNSRKDKSIDWVRLTIEDASRRRKVHKLIAQGKIKTEKDYYYAAMIFQHGNSTKDFLLANTLAKKSMKMGYKEARWLYAATTDRLLRSQGKKQKFGTQYEHVVLKEGDKYYNAMLLQPYDKKTTDLLRAKYDVPTLEESKLRETKKRRL